MSNEPMTDERLRRIKNLLRDGDFISWPSISELVDEVDRLREENEQMEKTLERKALGQAKVELQILKLRKVVDYFRENHHCEYEECGKGPCSGCDAFRELDEEETDDHYMLR